MIYVNYAIIGLFVFFVLRMILPTKGLKHITTIELKEELKHKNKQFIDVRTPNEFRRGSIKGFKNIPLQQLAKKAPNDLTKEEEVIVICQSGMRSQKACRKLKKLGYTNVVNVKGGVSSWGP